MGPSCNKCFISFLQSQECELKVIEQEKEVTVLLPKDACKCHKEDLAKALNVRGFSSFHEHNTAGCAAIDPNHQHLLKNHHASAHNIFSLLFRADLISEAKFLVLSPPADFTA